MTPSNPVTDRPLQVSVDRQADDIQAIAQGYVLDGKPEDEYIALSDTVAYLLSEPEGEVIGFLIEEISELVPQEVDQLWEGLRFDAPMLALASATMGEIAVTALREFPEDSSLDVELFHTAIAHQESPEHAEMLWRVVLAANNLKGHFGLGYTLCELGRHREAYAHLRYYTEITPRNAWAFCWLGHACAGFEERSEAEAAYRRAIELAEEGSYETDAPECLEQL